MSVTFTVCGGTGARCATCLDVPQAPELTISDANAERIMNVLGYPTPDRNPSIAPEATPEQAGIDAVDFALRILVAMTADTPRPGYLHDRLDQLQDLSEHAISYGCLITWQTIASSSEKPSQA